MDYTLSPMSLIRRDPAETSPIRVRLNFDDCDSSAFMEVEESKYSPSIN